MFHGSRHYQIGILPTWDIVYVYGQTYFQSGDIPEDAAIRCATAAIDAITLLFFSQWPCLMSWGPTWGQQTESNT